MEKIRLRPHHLLCLQKFVGEGYDGVFTKNLAKIVEFLSSNPETEITLIEGCDEVCASCPDKFEGVCTDGEKVIKLDSGVLDTCKLNYGISDSWKNLSGIAKEIFKTDNFDKICGSCQWFNLCKSIAD